MEGMAVVLRDRRTDLNPLDVRRFPGHAAGSHVTSIANDIKVVSLSLRATNGSVAISPLLGLLQSLRSFAMIPYLMRLY